MSYEAIVCHIHTRKHPNADKIQIGVAGGYQVIIGLEVQDGELGVYFPVDGALSHEFCMAANLYRKHPETGESMGGYFDTNRRIRAQKLRGVVSEGFWVPLDKLSWTGVKLDSLKAGDSITTLNGKLVCEKYMTPATQKAIQASIKKGKPKFSADLKRHFDTKQLKSSLSLIPDNSIVYITEKLHGTSGRTGYIQVSRSPKSKIKRFINKWLNKMLPFAATIFKDTVRWEKVTGSRNVVFDPENPTQDSYRENLVKDLRLHKGETFYYEIVGYDGRGGTIMGTHVLTDKNLIKKYGNNMVYSYGQQPGTYGMYVYRITNTNEEGKVTELSWHQVIARCRELGIKHVPELERCLIRDQKDLYSLVQKWDVEETHSVLDSTTLMEGVCFRIEHEDSNEIFKLKHFQFKVLEGIAKNDIDYIDVEEIA